MATMVLTKEPQSSLWFATLNINGFIKNGWQDRKDLCGQVIKGMKCELLGFQEFGEHCMEDFNRAGLNMEWVLSDAMGNNHNAIAYNPDRFKKLDSYTIPLSPSGKMQKAWGGGLRCMHFARLHDKEFKADIQLVNFHLDHESCPARNHSINIILNFLEEQEDIPTLITADGNMSVDSGFWKWYEPKMRRPYDLLIEAGYKDCWRLGNPNNARRPNMFHNFQGMEYKTHDEFGTWDTDLNLASKHFKVLQSHVVREGKRAQNGRIIYPSDHYFMKSLVTMK